MSKIESRDIHSVQDFCTGFILCGSNSEQGEFPEGFEESSLSLVEPDSLSHLPLQAFA